MCTEEVGTRVATGTAAHGAPGTDVVFPLCRRALDKEAEAIKSGFPMLCLWQVCVS